MKITTTTIVNNATITVDQFETAIDKAIKSLISLPNPWFGGNLETAEDWLGDVGFDFVEEVLKALGVSIECEDEEA